MVYAQTPWIYAVRGYGYAPTDNITTSKHATAHDENYDTRQTGSRDTTMSQMRHTARANTSTIVKDTRARRKGIYQSCQNADVLSKIQAEENTVSIYQICKDFEEVPLGIPRNSILCIDQKEQDVFHANKTRRFQVKIFILRERSRQSSFVQFSWRKIRSAPGHETASSPRQSRRRSSSVSTPSVGLALMFPASHIKVNRIKSQ
ncbi:hypothetical protein AVEN_188223-1 [Araneus ventricosus]|uniref:Uncharacterized protein n=1 Tax=Araneus ventricosus TaxID=182803 RepID=A0A4Y2SGN7_ARAVE|nr:hypothetical protein AVEN_188223-1 [Araneus ventricosus]